MNQDDDFLFGAPESEADEPIEVNDNVEESLSAVKLDREERDKQRKEKQYFSAFKLIIGCLVFLGIIYIVEVDMNFQLGKDSSDVTSGIIEIVKTLLFTLSGYLFARKENGD